MADISYKAIAVPTRVLLHPDEPVRLGGDLYRWAADQSASMRRASTQGQTWRNVTDVNLVSNPAELRVDTYQASTAGVGSSLAIREDGVMLVSEVDDATAGFLCHLATLLKTTFSLAPIPRDLFAGTQILRDTRESLLGRMKKGPFEDSYDWTNIAHVNDGPDVVKRYKIKTGEIAPDTDKKADAKAKKAAAVKEKAKEKGAVVEKAAGEAAT
jgi:hypothetical protein